MKKVIIFHIVHEFWSTHKVARRSLNFLEYSEGRFHDRVEQHTLLLELSRDPYKPPVNEPIGPYQIQYLKQI